MLHASYQTQMTIQRSTTKAHEPTQSKLVTPAWSRTCQGRVNTVGLSATGGNSEVLPNMTMTYNYNFNFHSYNVIFPNKQRHDIISVNRLEKLQPGSMVII